MRIRKYIFLIIFFTIFFLPTSTSISVTPTSFEERLRPSTLYVRKFTVSTTNSTYVNLSFVCDEYNTDICSWSSFIQTPDRIYLPPNSSQDIFFQVLTPEDIEMEQRLMKITANEQNITFSLKVKYEESVFERIFVKLYDFWNKKIFEFPNPNFGFLYGWHFVLMGILVFFIALVILKIYKR